MSTRKSINDPWSVPVNLGPIVNSSGVIDCYASLSSDDLELYFSGYRPGGYGNQDIWVTMRDSKDSDWGTPVNLGATINTSYKDWLPWISSNGLELYMERFIDMLQNIRKSGTSEWLTVNDIAKELKVSKTIVYRLIHKGELEAVNIVENNGKIAERGHYRIQRSSLNKYLEVKKVRPFPSNSVRSSRSKDFPKVKNHLGL